MNDNKHESMTLKTAVKRILAACILLGCQLYVLISFVIGSNMAYEAFQPEYYHNRSDGNPVPILGVFSWFVIFSIPCLLFAWLINRLFLKDSIVKKVVFFSFALWLTLVVFSSILGKMGCFLTYDGWLVSGMPDKTTVCPLVK